MQLVLKGMCTWKAGLLPTHHKDLGHSCAQCHVVESAAGVHAVSNPVEFILVDGGILQSRSSAIQIGPESHANFGSLVFQNISIEQSHRWALP